jgi:hypothetical protein
MTGSQDGDRFSAGLVINDPSLEVVSTLPASRYEASEEQPTPGQVVSAHASDPSTSRSDDCCYRPFECFWRFSALFAPKWLDHDPDAEAI